MATEVLERRVENNGMNHPVSEHEFPEKIGKMKCHIEQKRFIYDYVGSLIGDDKVKRVPGLVNTLLLIADQAFFCRPGSDADYLLGQNSMHIFDFNKYPMQIVEKCLGVLRKRLRNSYRDFYIEEFDNAAKTNCSHCNREFRVPNFTPSPCMPTDYHGYFRDPKKGVYYCNPRCFRAEEGESASYLPYP